MVEHGEIGYYSKELNELKERVSNCDIRTLDSIEFFLTQANMYTSGISVETEKEVRDNMRRFMRDCKCH